MAQTKKKSEKRQRTNLKAFRLDDEELAAFMANCEAANLAGADWFRVRCCSQKPIRKLRKRRWDETLLTRILGALGKWGNNLNQIAHAVNIARMRPDAVDVAATLNRCEAKIDKIYAALNDIRTMVRKTLLGHDLEG